MLFVARQSAERLLEVVGLELFCVGDGLIGEHFGQQGSCGNARRTALRLETGGDDMFVFEFEIKVQQVAANGIRRRAFVCGVGHCAGVAGSV